MSKARESPAATGGAAAILLRYLRDQNRPHSAQDAFGNLQREHGLGKTDQFPTVSDSELKALDNEISELSSKVQTLQQSCRHMESELKDLNGSMTTPEMIKEIEELKKDCASYTEKLERIKSAANHVTPEEKEKVYNEKKLYCKEWRRRKRMATELLDAILEGYPKSKKQFFEEVGIETDEDYNVTLPVAV
ncbi:homologous-pairing protein 2 homolog isoform X2 [Chrysemys picta bellii]|uniref:homologous-pairing protein 2 homolog isoform X2 n=1 Tax=Chrysemys picta bellii TaxID=8478 RepID=UPI0032B13357